MELGLAGATQSMTNTGTINIGYNDGDGDSGADATLAIAETTRSTAAAASTLAETRRRSSAISRPATLSPTARGVRFMRSLPARSATALASPPPTISPFDNYGDVYASADNVTLTINTGANTVYDFGGLLEADDNGTLDHRFADADGSILFLLVARPAGGTIEATGGGLVEIASTVANGSAVPRSSASPSAKSSWASIRWS